MPCPRFRPLALGIAVSVLSLGAGAEIVTLGGNPQPLPECPFPGLAGLCKIDSAARAVGVVSDFAAIRIGQSGQGGLQIGDGATVSLTRTELAPGVPQSPNLIVGDNVHASGALSVSGSGRLSITVPDAGNGSGGLFVGPFAAAPSSTGATTIVGISDGGQVSVFKPGGWNVAAAVGVGYGAGSVSSLNLDGGITGFGNQAAGARLDTTGNLSIGRLGQGDVNVFRNADLSAHFIFMSTIGNSGVSSLGAGVGSSITAAGIFAGIGLLADGSSYDPSSAAHGRAAISTRFGGTIAAPIVMGEGATLMGTGTLAGPVSNFGGTIRPGFSPGTLHFGAGLDDHGGHIVIEIGPDGRRDGLDIGGDLSFDGTTIEFAFIEGFAPEAGFTHAFAQVAGRIDLGDADFTFSGLRSGFGFDVRVDVPSGALQFVALTDGVSLPLPSSLALCVAAGAAAAGLGRRAPRSRRRRSLLPG